MDRKILLPGTKVDLVKIDRRTKLEDSEKTYYSQVLEYDNGEKIELSMPTIRGRVIPLEPGEEYILCFYTEHGMYQCKGQIITRFKKESLNILEVLFESDLEKIQRRQFYRLDCFWDIWYADTECQDSKKEIEEYDSEHLDWKTGTATDISGGGCRFHSDSLLEKDTIILIRLGNPIMEKWEGKVVEARVISSKELINKQGMYEHRIEFIEISHSDREKIIRIIFEEERKIRKRERGYT